MSASAQRLSVIAQAMRMGQPANVINALVAQYNSGASFAGSAQSFSTTLIGGKASAPTPFFNAAALLPGLTMSGVAEFFQKLVRGANEAAAAQAVRSGFPAAQTISFQILLGVGAPGALPLFIAGNVF